MIHDEFSPSHYTDLPFEADIAPNHIFQDLHINYLVNPLKKVKGFMIQSKLKGVFLVVRG